MARERGEPQRPKPKRGEPERAKPEPSRGPHDDRERRLEAACRAHLEFLRKNCPHLLPAAPLEPGTTGPGLPVDRKRAGSLVAVAAREAVAAAALGRFTTDDLPRAVVWESGPDALLVLLDSISVRTSDGVITVAVDVACDELREATDDERAAIEIDFVIGTEKRPTGLLVAATAPRGPEFVVARWGDSLVALAWQALLDSAAGLAAEAGVDADGAGLVPSAWTASSEGIVLVPQARHAIDRQVAIAIRR